MSTYTAFEEEFLVGAYLLSEEKGEEIVTVREVLETFALDPKPNWLNRALTALIEYGYSNDIRHIGQPIDQRIFLNGIGVREAEQLVARGVQPCRRESEPPPPELPEGIKEISGGRIFVSDDPTWRPTDPREGDLVFGVGDAPELIPASDRMVSLDHNSAPYRDVKDGLAGLREELRTANDLECAPEERERLLASLSAAERLWESAQLKIIQIKVGIIITIEDTIELLGKAGKAVGKAALIDIVKSIVRHATGIHL